MYRYSLYDRNERVYEKWQASRGSEASQRLTEIETLESTVESVTQTDSPTDSTRQYYNAYRRGTYIAIACYVIPPVTVLTPPSPWCPPKWRPLLFPAAAVQRNGLGTTDRLSGRFQ